MLEKSITKMTGAPNLDGLLIQTDSRTQADQGLGSNISLLNFELTSLSRQIVANFQFTNMTVADDAIVVGDEFGVIHIKTDDSNLIFPQADLNETYPSDCEIQFSDDEWISAKWRNVPINSLSFSKSQGLLVCYADGEVWTYNGQHSNLELTLTESITLCQIGYKGEFIVCADNGIYVKPNNNKWHNLPLPKYNLARVIFTDLKINPYKEDIIYICSRNGFLLRLDLQTLQLQDMQLPIVPYFNIDVVKKKLAFACQNEGVQVILKNKLQRIIDCKTYRMAFANDTLYVSSEEEHLIPQINAYSINKEQGRIDLINSVKIGQ